MNLRKYQFVLSRAGLGGIGGNWFHRANMAGYRFTRLGATGWQSLTQIVHKININLLTKNGSLHIIAHQTRGSVQLAKLTTHVLDTAHGRPAAGVAISLFRVGSNGRQSVCTTRTNADGRCDQPLIEGAEFQPGLYELEFAAGDYFRAAGVALPDPPFLDIVVLQFGIADASQNYHVPLVVSPWSYSTYRGS